VKYRPPPLPHQARPMGKRPTGIQPDPPLALSSRSTILPTVEDTPLLDGYAYAFCVYVPSSSAYDVCGFSAYVHAAYGLYVFYVYGAIS
jgi:hypothetical protein